MSKVKRQKKCQYGSKCYRKNPQHLKDFSHSSDEEENETVKVKQTGEPVTKKRKIEDFFHKAKPDRKIPEPSTSTTELESVETNREDQEESHAVQEEPDASEEASDVEVPPSPEDVQANIKSKFLVDMPDDFYKFWEFAKTIDSNDPTNAFKSKLDLQLVGPYDILAGKTKAKNSRGKRPCYLRHWRYYYDPPEFLTILRGNDKSQFHMGYFRDDPSEMPVFVASNAAKENGTITPRGANIYAAVNWYIDDAVKKDKSRKAELSPLQSKLQADARKHCFSLEAKTKEMKERDKRSVTRTFHGAGMVVPVDANDVGYRELPETTGNLKKIFKRIADASSEAERDAASDPLMEIVMLVQFANDECDYGEGLELGLDMFTYGAEQLHGQIMRLMPLAYQLLERHAFADVITAHLEQRKHTASLSELD